MLNPLPAPEQRQLVGELATQLISTRNLAMSTLQNSINCIPNLRQRVRNLGGLRNIATKNPLLAHTRQILPALSSLENSLFLETFTEGDLRHTPSAQTTPDRGLGAGIGQAIDIGASIKDH